MVCVPAPLRVAVPFSVLSTPRHITLCRDCVEKEAVSAEVGTSYQTHSEETVILSHRRACNFHSPRSQITLLICFDPQQLAFTKALPARPCTKARQSRVLYRPTVPISTPYSSLPQWTANLPNLRNPLSHCTQDCPELRPRRQRSSTLTSSFVPTHRTQVRTRDRACVHELFGSVWRLQCTYLPVCDFLYHRLWPGRI